MNEGRSIDRALETAGKIFDRTKTVSTLISDEAVLQFQPVTKAQSAMLLSNTHRSQTRRICT
jgi:hypothetical protein